MHVLVKDGQEREIDFIGTRPLCQSLQHLLLNQSHVAKRLFACRQGQVPARVVSHGGGVVQPVRIGLQGVALVGVAQHPLLLEPAQVADLPKQRVYGRQRRAAQLVVVQVGDQLERTAAGVLHPLSERIRRSCCAFGESHVNLSWTQRCPKRGQDPWIHFNKQGLTA